jgi:dynein heavy chain
MSLNIHSNKRTFREFQSTFEPTAPKVARNKAAGAAGAGGAAGGDGKGIGASRRALTLRLPLLRGMMMPSYTQQDGSGAARASRVDKSMAAMKSITFGEGNDHQLRTGEDAITFFARHGSNTPLKFVYCNRPEQTDDFRPYDLVIVPRKKVKPEYFTISASGVVCVQPGQPSEFISLSDWMHQSTMFNLLRSMRYFKYYLVSKMFKIWRSNVRYSLYCQQRRKLARNLFLARKSFCPSLIEVNKLLFEMDQIRLSNLRPDVSAAEVFMQEQADERTAGAKRFEDCVEKLEAFVEKVCKGVKARARAYDHDIVGDDISNSRFAQHLLGGNGRIKSMVAVKQERAERVRRLKHAALEADMLGDFIRLVDYMEVAHLVSIARNTTTEFLNNLLQPRKPLFVTTVSFDPDSIAFSPTSADIHRIISTMLDGIINTVDTVDRILFLQNFKPFVSSSLTDSPKVARIIHHSVVFNDTKREIDEKIDSDFDSAVNQISFLEKYRPVYDYGNQWDFERYCSKEHTVESIQKDLAQQTKWGVDIERIRNLYNTGIFQIKTQDLKGRLLPVTETALSGMKELLLKIFHTKCSELNGEYQDMIKQLQEQPQNLPQYAAHIENFRKIKDEGVRVKKQSMQITAMHQLLLDHEMKIPSNDAVQFDDLRSSVLAFEDQLKDCKARMEESLAGMRQTVYKNISRLNNELTAQQEQIGEGIFIDANADPQDALAACDAMAKDLAEIKQQTETLQGYQVLFGVEQPYPFLQLKETMSIFEKRRLFWQTYLDWNEITNKWDDAVFSSLDVEEMDAEVRRFYKAAHQFNKQFEQSLVSQQLKDKIKEFQTIMPMVLELGNKAMEATHWHSLFKNEPDQEYYPPTTLKKLRSPPLNIFDYRQLISETCEQAVGEFTLKESLKKVAANWQDQEFVVTGYQKTKDVFILGDIEDVTISLEDNQVTLQTMMASRHVGAVQSQVEMWDKKLLLLSDILDQWVICQRNWMYLEPIFGAADIQRQLPMEAKMFQDVNHFYKETMRKVHMNQNVMKAIGQPGLLAMFIKSNSELDKIQKHLEEYLETKRSLFPRFYFLSNDELLQILAQSREPQAVQPHLRKCFDSVTRIIFTDEPNSVEVVGMVSGEGEEVAFLDHVFTTGNTENWLCEIEKEMRHTVKDNLKEALASYPTDGINRGEWLAAWPAQSVLTADQIMWTHNAASAIRQIEAGGNPRALKEFLEFSKRQIGSMVDMVRTDLPKLLRKMMSALVVLDVHARDVVSRLIECDCKSLTDFEWSKQLRYYWMQNGVDQAMINRGDGKSNGSGDSDDDSESDSSDDEDIEEDCVVEQTNTKFTYGYEYLGCMDRLVITPLTDKAYLTLTGAIHLHFGGSPQGPAGTGKTETVKDLSKALALQVVVFNCSDGLDVKMMARFFSGLAQAGAWACFDEFNRIDIEVLSVIAQQILTIQQAIAARKERFEFEQRLIPLSKNFGVFITMNPGYAGRTELPDNLKALFRPIAMMVPDYALIAEIILFSEGFQDAHRLAKKMVQLYKLSSEQLSKQDHYDFGMRAVKSVLVMAGALKRKDPTVDEDVTLIRAMRDSNVPKFLAQDLPLFSGILADLFPNAEVPYTDYGTLQQMIEAELADQNLQAVPSFVTKILQLQETTVVRHGVMLVGATGTGKTVCAATLAGALGRVAEQNPDSEDAYMRKVERIILNPKAVTMGELYGQTNAVSQEWTDGLVPFLVRQAAASEADSRTWVTFDGPVDALWIENMNTVLDDNKVLCLANGERIKVHNRITMLFEVEDLSVASPATVSRCGMVYLEEINLGWKPLLNSWFAGLEERLPEVAPFVRDTLMQHVEALLTYVETRCNQLIAAVRSNLLTSCLLLLDQLLTPEKGLNFANIDESQREKLVSMYLFQALVWSFGANLDDDSRHLFNVFVRARCGALTHGQLADEGSVYDYCVDAINLTFVSWKSKVSEFLYNHETPYFSILVPTAETTKYAYFLDTLIPAQRNVLLKGDTGVGTTVIVQRYLDQLSTAKVTSTQVMFSAQTTSKNLQDVFETKLDKRRKNVLGPAVGKKFILFVDDLNMPVKEEYGAQPPIELLRQCIDQGGIYDRQRLFFKYVRDVVTIAACAPPGGGRNVMTPRLTRHFHMMWQPQLDDNSMKTIFSSILCGFLAAEATNLSAQMDVKEIGTQIVGASVSIYNSIRRELLPTPSKSHYTFNLRDVSKVVQGIVQVQNKHVSDSTSLLRLWMHESARVFRDRLVDESDRKWFDVTCKTQLSEVFNEQWELDDLENLLFGDYLTEEDKEYQEVTNIDVLNETLEYYLEQYNLSNPHQMNLVFFHDAVQHLSRISRILRQPRGNALLVGVGGSGRHSLTRLAASMVQYKTKSIEITRAYSIDDWRETLKQLLKMAGADDEKVVFLFSDGQVVHEQILEDINSLLNSGEVPNLFDLEEYESLGILQKVKPLAKAAGKPETRDGVLNHFVQLCRENLHIVLTFSPIGESFRSRCRQYPSLVNCCTIDWYNAWPDDALHSVADRFLSERKDLGIDDYKEKLCAMCVKIHSSVTDISDSFYAQLRRRNYTTPTSYLELLKLYVTMLDQQRTINTDKVNKYRGGLHKLTDTNEKVEDLRKELIKLQPVLKKSAEETAQLLVELENDQADANEKESICTADAEECEKTTRRVQLIKDDCQQDLDEALPAYEAAIAALDTLKKEHITELKSFQHPPKGVQMVMEAVCLLFNVEMTWPGAKKLLGKVKFLEMCMTYDKDRIPAKIIKKLQRYIKDPEFQPHMLESVSVAAVSLCMWARAMNTYARVAKQVEPKRKALAEAEEVLRSARATLASKQMALRAVKARVAALESKYKDKEAEKEQLKFAFTNTQTQLGRAEKLVHGLSSEESRWGQTADELESGLQNLIGDIMLSVGCISYLGPFNQEFRAELTKIWNRHALQAGIPVDPDFSLVRTLSDPLVVRKWNIMGLPADSHSIQNAIFVSRGRRWPLMIDPQSQANRWVKQLGKADNMNIIKLSDPNYLRVLENAIRYGQAVLLENVEETLDAAIEPVLIKQISKKGGQMVLHLGNDDVPYSSEFRFYITTKLPNPHYLPEVFVKVTIINFTVTPRGLEDQLLVSVCSMERPELEEKNDRLIVSIADDKKELADLEAKILRMLAEVKGNVLDDEELINALSASKTTSTNIKGRLQEAEEIIKTVASVREEYRVVATRGSLIYFTIADMALVDPMYQYSLQFFTGIYKQRIVKSEKSSTLSTRLAILLDDLTEQIYTNICRGLFEKDKLLFSFLIASAIDRNAGKVSTDDWNFFVRGGDSQMKDPPANPCEDWLTNNQWIDICKIQALTPFALIGDDFRSKSKAKGWQVYRDSFTPDAPTGGRLPGTWHESLTNFQRLLINKILREDRVTFGVKEFVQNELGSHFTRSLPFDLSGVYADSSPNVPVVFVLSPGADPMQYLLKLAKEEDMLEDRFRYISLGQGQGPLAEELMLNGRRNGDWVCLQNCHLAASWMPQLERFLEENAHGEVHEDYRLWLTSMPSHSFPVAILQNSIKLTNEPPKGLANNVMRTFLDISEDDYESCSKPEPYKKLLFGLAFFHAVVQERRKFGPIGWNIPYEWMNSDLDVSKRQLKMYLEEQDDVPWQTLIEIIGEVNYSGRVTDSKDQRCVRSILQSFFNPRILDDDYKFTQSGIYYAPPVGSLQEVRDYVSSLPDDTPEAFGLHENADVVFQMKETRELMHALTSIQPKATSAQGGRSPDKIVLELLADLKLRLPPQIDKAGAHDTTFEDMESGKNTMGVFLGQELVRYNRLLKVIKDSMTSLEHAIKGLVVMSTELEAMFHSLLYNKVPLMWEVVAYPSLKPLAFWFTDLVKRVGAINDWLVNGPPGCFWISAFFFPQGFMTAVLQRYARKTQIPIDTLRFRSEVLNVDPAKAEAPAKGCLIHGLYLQGAGWDREHSQLIEADEDELFAPLPVVWLDPETTDEPLPKGHYECPVYKTSRRAGVLSTTGHSTNYVMSFFLPSFRSGDHWIRRGTALLTMLDNE